MNAAAADGVQGQIADCGRWRSFLCRLSEDGRLRRRGGQRRRGDVVAGVVHRPFEPLLAMTS